MTNYTTGNAAYAGIITALLVQPKNAVDLHVTETFSLFTRNDADTDWKSLRLRRSFLLGSIWRHRYSWTPRTWLIAWATHYYFSFDSLNVHKGIDMSTPAVATKLHHAILFRGKLIADLTSNLQICHVPLLIGLILHIKHLPGSINFSTAMACLCIFTYSQASTWSCGQFMEMVAGTLGREVQTAFYWTILGEYITKENLHCTRTMARSACNGQTTLS